MWYQFIKAMLLKHNAVVLVSNYYFILLDLFFVPKPPTLQSVTFMHDVKIVFDYRTFYSCLFLSFQTFYAEYACIKVKI